MDCDFSYLSFLLDSCIFCRSCKEKIMVKGTF